MDSSSSKDDVRRWSSRLVAAAKNQKEKDQHQRDEYYDEEHNCHSSNKRRRLLLIDDDGTGSGSEDDNQKVDLTAASVSASPSSSYYNVCNHRPTATSSSLQQDCGILPKDVPWGYICGYPTTKSGSGGDLYGGGHYIDSASSTITNQGRAIKKVSTRFGDGKTLPFTPCKRGYMPIKKVDNNNDQEPQQQQQHDTVFMVACSFHEKLRRKRILKENGMIRGGEAHVNELFWRTAASLVKKSKKSKKVNTAKKT
ncbi:hypothetical protein FRACYDRAFT_233646 [Fragilariopsis cylindrus CCMP1102]|uniref:Uncharacterized protein n=1 Tax=Fragilariopsis cylindrus CCMP1102 TaxID=635003 RepID=A0A1E7FZA4_9STRA|nr:hypothetical protein FRACYDRAFT_233646 [Fragilariopsis cylindrus CCMP1102]|eukprot:OEU23477.1 hypothetical protein FRACYDRAFT_233646 [Fragilariopsis cylindrus CCMP1102]